MDDQEILKQALEHEEEAVELYRDWAQQTDTDTLKDMLLQFAMNESWHASALRANLDAQTEQKEKPTE